MKPAAAPSSAVTCVGTATPMVSAIGNFIGLSGRQPLGESQHAVAGHFAFEGTAECRRDRDLRADTGAARGLGDLEPGLDALVDTAALIPLAERFTGGDRHADLGAAGGARTIEAFAIQYQADVSRDPARLCQRRRAPPSASAICGTRLGFTKLATSIRRRPARCQAAYELDLCRRRQHLRFALQAITRPDFDDLDARWIPWREF